MDLAYILWGSGGSITLNREPLAQAVALVLTKKEALKVSEGMVKFMEYNFSYYPVTVHTNPTAPTFSNIISVATNELTICVSFYTRSDRTILSISLHGADGHGTHV